MSGFAPVPLTPAVNLNSNHGGTRRSLFPRNHTVYPPPQGEPDNDDFIRGIPIPEDAPGDFQGVPFAHPPRRDVPSILIYHLSNPQTHEAEPDWFRCMEHFKSRRCLDGPGNLQDLYLYVTRVAIPNAIITNRRLLHELYMDKRTLGNVSFRYDFWYTRDTYLAPNLEPLTESPIREVRPILRSSPTPDGELFIRWLGLPPNTPVDRRPCPLQLAHRPCPLDGYLHENEGYIRRILPQALMTRTAKVLRLFWWISAQNAWLVAYEGAQPRWFGIEQHVV